MSLALISLVAVSALPTLANPSDAAAAQPFAFEDVNGEDGPIAAPETPVAPDPSDGQDAAPAVPEDVPPAEPEQDGADSDSPLADESKPNNADDAVADDGVADDSVADEETDGLTLFAGDFAPACAVGYVYGLSANGQIRQVLTGQTSATNFGSSASGVSSFNGLGIGTGGEKVFAYERSSRWFEPGSSRAAIWAFDTTTGQWADTGVSVNSNSSSRTVGFVAGGVDLNTGNYYIGGFTSDGGEFRIWEYVPGATTANYKGYINTSSGAGGSNNGDLAFDSAGNFFVVRGSGTTTTVFSVTAANFQAANGGQITAAGSRSVTTMSNVNGVAFDASGKAYLGSGGELRSYDMPGWSNSNTIVGSGLNSTDLATCSSPATVTLEKDLPSGRFKTTDQFDFELKQGNQTLGTATTSGDAAGIQEERVGPLPVAPGSTLNFSETFVGGANATDYATSYSCTADGQPLNSGTGTSGSVTVPVGADAVVCRITNQLLIASVNIHKEIETIDGTRSDGAGWKVGAGVTATAGTATPTPAPGTQITNSSGDASWNIRFDSKTGRANVEVSEQMQSGFEFAEGTCFIESFDGQTSEIAITNYNGQTLTGVGPGDKVSCDFVNKQLPATIQVDKRWTINDGDPITHGEQPDGLTADLTLSPNLGTPPVWGQPRGPFAVNDKVTIGESAAIDQAELPGCTLGAPVISGTGISGTQPLGSELEVTLANATNSYTITNPVTCAQELTLTKVVDNTYDGEFSVGNDWLKDPSSWDGKLIATDSDDEELPFNSGQTQSVESGDYALTEQDVASYMFESLDCVGVELEGDTVTIGLGQKVECTFTNIVAPGSVQWAKTGAGSSGFLTGSEWQLTGPNGIDTQITNESDLSGPGEFSLEGLPWGDYTLTETKAPAGYQVNSDAFEFTIAAGDALSVDLGSIENMQRTGPDLPLTGSIGRDHIYLAGAIIILASMTAYLVWRRRRAHA